MQVHSTPVRHVVLAALAAACSRAAAPDAKVAPLPPLEYPAELPSSAPQRSSKPVLITNATVLTAAGRVLNNAHVLLRHGRIEAVAEGPLQVGPEVEVVDATGKFITPGIIDVHSHLGVYPYPEVRAHADGNEMVTPTTPEVWAEHAFWPQDPGLWRALSGGVTTLQILPGSANLIGGRSFVMKPHRETAARALRVPEAPFGLKMACGENPKRTYGNKGGPKTRMGNAAHLRQEFQGALEYARRWQEHEHALAKWRVEHAGKESEENPPAPPSRDFGKELLVRVLRGEVLVHTHCYRADDMHTLLDIAEEFGFSIRTFHHALEAYKLRERLAHSGVAVATWADWWGFKMEAYDGIPQNAAMLARAGVRAIIHSDSATDVQHLNQEAAKAKAAGAKVGLHISDDEALRWITANPAWALGLDAHTGTLEPGKMADVVVWDAHPLSVYARAEKVFIDGQLAFDRRSPLDARTDFEVGQPTEVSP